MRGFTLVEIIVAVSLFTIVIGAAFTFLSFGIGVQRDSLGSQTLVDQTSFVAEYMSRSIRQAQKDIGGGCITPGSNYDRVSASEIKFLDKGSICRTILLDTSLGYGVIEENGEVLTGSDIDVLELRFEVEGEPQSDNIQPRVTFFIHAKAQSTDTEIFFQTTISQRDFDVQL